MFSDISFTFSEGLAIAGLAQGVSILVYLLFRQKAWRQSLPAILYFFVLTLCFVLQFALRLEDMIPCLRHILWAMWASAPILSYMLIVQIATTRHDNSGTQVSRPHWRDMCSILLVPAILVAARIFVLQDDACKGLLPHCDTYFETLYWLGSMAGAVTIGLLWLQRGIFTGLRQGPGGYERYWLVLTFIVSNIGIVVVMLMRAWGKLELDESDALLISMGIAALYLASSSLFRVYPTVIDLAPAQPAAPAKTPLPLNPEEEALLARVHDLIDVQKVYHEPSFGRGALAREVGCSESQLSRVVNFGYGKSLPRLLNERRVADAQRMLADEAIPIQVVAFEVGFNSLASFNRVFKEITGITPTEARQIELAKHAGEPTMNNR